METDTSRMVDAGSQDAIRCVTVRQLLEATQTHSTSQFKIDGNKTKKITIVANLCFLDIRQTFTDFGLDDGTGRIKARRWNDNLDSLGDTFGVHEFPYLRVVGDLEQFMGKKSIKVIDIRRVSSPYEPYYHILHTICDTLTYERGSPPSAAGETRDLSNTSHNDTDIEELGIALYHKGPVASPLASTAHHALGDVSGGSLAVAAQFVDAKAEKSKAPVPDQEPPAPPPPRSAPLPIPQTHHQRAKDVGITGNHDISVKPGDQHKNPASGIEEPDIPNYAAPVASQFTSIVYPPPGNARRGSHAGPAARSTDANISKGKTDQKSLIPLPSSFASLPISPTHYWGAKDVVIPKRSGVVLHESHGTSAQYKNTTSEVPHGLQSSMSPNRPFILNDPYSELSSLQREVLLCIQRAAAQNPMSSLYPTSEDKPTWEGVHLSDIVRSVQNRSSLELHGFRDCIEGLVEEGYIFNTIDEEHYSCA